MAGYTIQRTDSSSVVTLQGDLTAPQVPALQTELRQTLAQGVRDITFDFGQTETLDSSGIGLLIATRNSLARVDGRVNVVNLSAPLLTLLQSMRLVTRLNATGRQA